MRLRDESGGALANVATRRLQPDFEENDLSSARRYDNERSASVLPVREGYPPPPMLETSSAASRQPRASKTSRQRRPPLRDGRCCSVVGAVGRRRLSWTRGLASLEAENQDRVSFLQAPAAFQVLAYCSSVDVKVQLPQLGRACDGRANFRSVSSGEVWRRGAQVRAKSTGCRPGTDAEPQGENSDGSCPLEFRRASAAACATRPFRVDT